MKGVVPKLEQYRAIMAAAAAIAAELLADAEEPKPIRLAVTLAIELDMEVRAALELSEVTERVLP